MTKDLHGFEQFMKRREQAANAYVNGDAAPIGRLATRVSPATFFGPIWGHVQGAEQLWSTHERGAAQFDAGGASTLEIPQTGADDGVGYWVGLQHATARLRGSAEATPMTLRVTEVSRREDGDRKLVHRHADMLASAEEDDLREPHGISTDRETLARNVDVEQMHPLLEKRTRDLDGLRHHVGELDGLCLQIDLASRNP